MVAANQVSAIQNKLLERLARAATVGDAALAEQLATLENTAPEVAVVILSDTGKDAISNPYLVNVSLALRGIPAA